MEITIFENKLPLRQYDAESLDKILHTSFMFWLANLLSLKEDKEQNLLNSINEIKYHFFSLGLDDVKKAFEMYVRCQLKIKPISNHIDPILVGQIFNDYRNLKPKPKKNMQQENPDEIRKKNNESTLRWLNEYEFTRKVEDTDFYVYRYFDSLGLIDYSLDFKKEIRQKAIDILTEENLAKKPSTLDEKRQFDKELKKIVLGEKEVIRSKCEVLALEHFLNQIYTSKESIIKFKNNFI